MLRVIGHLDLDYFFAQIEEVENPSLRELPVVICVYSGRTEDSGVVSTANYKAREFGVHSGTPIALAKKKLEGKGPSFIPMNHGKYEHYSERVMEILRKHSDIVEQTGIDEAFFDITRISGGDYDVAREIALQTKVEIFKKEELTCSVGIAPNKVVAKLASDFHKPDGLTVVRQEDITSFMGSMPVERLYGVGPKNAKILNSIGVITIADLSRKNVDELNALLGRKFAIYLWNAANGTYEEPVTETSVASQVSRIITLKHDSMEVPYIISQLEPAIEDVHRRVVERKVFFRSISAIGVLKDLSTRTKSKTLDSPTNNLSLLRKETIALFSSLTREGNELRRAGVKVSDLSESREQSSLAEFLG